jgi:hypothetical protein
VSTEPDIAVKEAEARVPPKVKRRAEHHAELLETVGEFEGKLPAGLSPAAIASLVDPPSRRDVGSVELARVLAAVEGLRVLSLAEVARQLGISKSTVKRSFAHLLVRVGERRVGMRLRDVLELVKPASE